jgi:hypothetical protein
MTDDRYRALEGAARTLLAAMDRQHGSAPFSLNVNTARNELRALLAPTRRESDRADRVAA